MNLFVKQKYNHGCREQIYDYQEGKGAGLIGRLGLTHIHYCMK